MGRLLRYFLVGMLLLNVQIVCAGGVFNFSVKAASTAIQKKNDYGAQGLMEISPEGQKAAGIKTEILRPRSLTVFISVPGEAIPSTDLTTIVASRIQAQIVRRLVKIGDHVEKGQALVRLSSVAMGQAQSDLIIANKEWIRAKKIKQKMIAAKYYHIADITYQQKYSKLLSYGMTPAQIKAFLKSNNPNKANGAFTLLAPRKGTVLTADFIEGQVIEPGKILYKIVDESILWVDAKLSNTEPTGIKKGSKAIVKTTHHKFPAYVLRIHHKIDEGTRTRIVRLSVSNPKDQLHPGEFVTCLIQTGKTPPVLAVHKTALMRTSDGDMVIYIEVKVNHFRAQKIQVIKKVGPWRIIKGVEPGVRIVTKGAFFVHSELLKGGFNTHNH